MNTIQARVLYFCFFFFASLNKIQNGVKFFLPQITAQKCFHLRTQLKIGFCGNFFHRLTFVPNRLQIGVLSCKKREILLRNDLQTQNPIYISLSRKGDGTCL